LLLKRIQALMMCPFGPPVLPTIEALNHIMEVLQGERAS
jgi:hypothetical protein